MPGDQLPITRGDRLLPPELHRIVDVPPEVERFANLTAVPMLTLKCLAVSRSDKPSCITAITTRSRKSAEWGFAIHAGLHSSQQVGSNSA